MPTFQSEPQQSPKPEDMPVQPLRSCCKGRLLIVDDDPDDLQMLGAFLSGEGFETRCAPDGRRSLAMAEADPPELVLLDVRLPGIDGYEVCRRLKNSEKTRVIPVIFLSGLDDVENKIRGFEAGGIDYIAKPFQEREVLARVETHLSLHRFRKQMQAQNISLDAMVQERTEELLGLTESLSSECAERERIGTALEERLRFESLLSDISARFVNLSPDEVDREIGNALRMVLEFFQVERSALIRTLPGKTSWEISHVAVSDNEVPPVPVGTVLSRAINPWGYEMLIDKRQILNITSLDDLPPEAHVDRQTWIEWGIRSNLNIPIYFRESIDYVIAVNSLKSERVWPTEIIPRLRLLGEILVNAMERRNAELALRESEERLDLATASAEAGIWIMNVNSGCVWVTDKLRELFGFDPDTELNIERFLEVIHPDDRKHVRNLVRRSLEKRELLAVEYRILHPDRSIRWIASRGRPYSRISDMPERLMGVSSDITQRKLMELQLSESQALLSALVDSTSDLIWSVDSERFGLLTFNRGLYEYFLSQRGIRVQVGMSPEDLFPPGEFVEKWRMFYRRALEEGSFTIEYLVYSGTRTLRLNLNRLKRDDTVFGVSVFGRDITNKKILELEARKLREELAHVTRVSTLGELTSALAHEINQPLTAILNNAQAAQRFLSQDNPDMQEVAEILGDIIRDDTRAAEIIRKFRSLLKKEEIRYESLSLNDIIEETLSVIGSDTALADISIVREFNASLPAIWGDRIQLQQVILNLILNAAEAMKEESPDFHKLIVRTTKEEEGFAKISIRDFGPGIRESDISRIFDPFYTTKSEGMGMGLAICKEIVKSHSGVIWAENNPDKGAVFSFTVPFESRARP